MTDYKLVPFEPTPEMIEAAEDAHMPFGDMDLALRMAVLAAPAVQGEPVGYVRPHQLEALRSGKVCGITMEDKPDAHNRVTIPLYTAPQPAEQQPDVAQLVEALEEIVKQYPNPNISHQDFRVHACRHAETALAAHRKQGSNMV